MQGGALFCRSFRCFSEMCSAWVAPYRPFQVPRGGGDGEKGLGGGHPSGRLLSRPWGRVQTHRWSLRERPIKPVFSPRSTTTKFAFVHVIDDLKKEAKQRHLDEPEAYWLASSGVADMGMCVLAAQMTNLRLHNASGDHVISSLGMWMFKILAS